MNPIVLGSLWMATASAFFALTYIVVRELSDTISTYELVFYRALFGVLFLTPWLIRNGWRALRTRRWKLYLLRGFAMYTGMLTWFYGLAHVDLADANAILFTGPFFTVIILQIFAGEPMGLDRWIAIGAGFLGTLMIVKPGFEVLVPAMIGCVYTAFTYGASNSITRMLLTTEDKNAVVFFMFALMLPMSIGPAAYHFSVPSWADLPLLALFAFIAYASIHCVARAYALASAASVMPAYYLQLPFVTLMAFGLYDEVPDTLTWLGAGVICASGYWIARAERKPA